MRKLLTILTICLLSFTLVSAQHNSEIITGEKLSFNQINQIKLQFQNQYSYNFTGNQTFKEDKNGQVQLEVTEQKKFMFMFNVQTKETYHLDEDGNVLETTRNVWSYLLNRNKRVEVLE